MYCKAKVDGQSIELILDSGSSGSVVTKKFLEKVGRQVDRPSNINMVGIHGDKKKALGEIAQLPIIIKNAEFPIDVVISEAQDYDVLVGNDWFIKYRATLDWPKNEVTLQKNGMLITEDASCQRTFPFQVIEDSDEEYEEEQQPYYQVSLQDLELLAKEDSLKINQNEYSWEYLEWISQYNSCPNDECNNGDCSWCRIEEDIREHLDLLAPQELTLFSKEKPGLTLKYFDNDGQGKQPTKAWKTDAGLDLYYTGSEPLILPAKATTLVNTFIALEIPEGTYAQLATRSSWAKKGITTVGGVCDAGYTGDIIVQLHNNQEQDYIIQRNEKIAQLILLPLVDIEKLERVDERMDLPASGRQQSGFGSSDRQQLKNEAIPTAYTVGELSARQRKQLDDLLEEYQDLFNNDLGRCGIEKHSINTEFARPIKQYAY